MKLNIFKYSFFLLLPFLFISAGAQENLSLAGAIKKGLENNYQIKITESSLEIAKNNNSWGQAGLFPSLSLNAFQSNRYDEGPNQLTGVVQEYNTNILSPAISMNWLLFGGFAVQMSKKNLALLEENSESTTALVVENTIQAIILAYYKVLMEEEKLDILEVIMTLSRDRFNYMQAKKDLGSAVTYDVLQAQNAYLSDSSTFLLQQMAVRTANMNLNLLMAVDAKTIYSLSDEFSNAESTFSFDDLSNNMFANNKTLQNQYINQQLLKNNIKLSQSGLYPSLSMSSGYDFASSRLKYKGLDAITGDAYDYYVNFSLNFNLFNGGKTRRAIANARITEDIGNLQLDELKQSMQIQLTTQYDLYNIRKQLLSVAQENIKSTKLNLDISEEKFKAGAINSFNLRDIQLLFLNTAFRELEARYNLVQSKTDLLRMSGGIISEYN
ncbi:MAG: TolC family protein [Bacteroidetes bacterium]|jgi:outer membrane protein|nr:TolC family protein [Bacteroidota bacterium]MBT5529654.1 TolC family protein [Cytophagia bacterium]MBT4729362.1 TolC family protein [Bacteroidota bacterium]MBT4969110.1 TolC family protein [Bacteroidota bacterium]MBT5991747.1 TolC family protein [Bacteroidota bacterium]